MTKINITTDIDILLSSYGSDLFCENQSVDSGGDYAIQDIELLNRLELEESNQVDQA